MKHDSLEESVIRAMDGMDSGLFPHLPYILQDFWEIGADPESIINLISKHHAPADTLRLLDLGCGKGAVSVRVARSLGCRCHAIDAIPAFIEEARKKAKEYGVSDLCRFEVGDIRRLSFEASAYDVVVLGAIGPVFGDYYQTLTTLLPFLRPGGSIIVDDGYIPDHSTFTHPLIQKHNAVIAQIQRSGMEVVDEMVFDSSLVGASNNAFMQSIPTRCAELARRYPDKKKLFLDYVEQQREESRVLEEEVVCSVMCIRRSGTP